MAKFRKKPIVIEAVQWFMNGDHPEDNATEMFDYPGGQRPQVIREGAVVRYFRRPDKRGSEACDLCGEIMHLHGWIDTLEGGHIVCPGDWVITGVKGEHYPCKPDIFVKTYEPEQGCLLVGCYYGTTTEDAACIWCGKLRPRNTELLGRSPLESFATRNY